jgi:hypothetical protein
MFKSKILLPLVFTLLYLSCSDKDVYDEDYYTLLNKILSQYDSSAVIVDSPKNYILFKPTNSNIAPPSPSSIYTTTIREIEMEWLKEDNYLNESDIIVMLDQTKQITFNRFDTTKIKYRTVNKDTVELLYQNYGASDFWEKFYSKIKSYNVIFISNPLFNSNESKMYFQIEYFCGGLCGYCMTYICEKRSNKWELIRQFVTWES